MITILVFIVIGIAVAIYQTKNGLWPDTFDYVMGIIIGIIVGFLLGLIVAILLPAKLETKIYTQKIESLQDNNSQSGSFFLGCGSIEGKMKYVYYFDTCGLYQMNQIDYNKAFIKYDTLAYVEEFREEFVKTAKINWFAVDITDSYYVFHVPKGTIKNNYSLDAQ